MADLTLYFPSTGAAPHDCAYSATWNDTSAAAHFIANTTKGTSAIAVRNPYRANGQTYGCGGQWVSPAQTAREWTTADKFDFAMLCRDSNAVACTLWVTIRIFNAAGDTVVGTLYDGELNATVFATTWVNRHNDGVAVQNAVSCPEGGHIVIEIGFKSTYAAGFAANMVVGEGTSTALPLNDTETNTDLYPWLAFTYGAADVTLPLTGVSGTASVGAVALSLALAVSGLVGTGAVGTLAPATTMPLSGISAPASVGTMPSGMAVVLAGIEALGEAGTVGQSVTVPLTGNVATGTVGTLNPDTSKAITGEAGTATVGSVTPTTPISGISAPASIGAVTPSTAIPITGNVGTGAVGTVVSSGGTPQTGAAATGYVGTVTPSVSLPVTGVAGTGSPGAVVPARAITVSGVIGTGVVGNVTPSGSDMSRPLTGVVGTGAVGTVIASKSAKLKWWNGSMWTPVM